MWIIAMCITSSIYFSTWSPPVLLHLCVIYLKGLWPRSLFVAYICWLQYEYYRALILEPRPLFIWLRKLIIPNSSLLCFIQDNYAYYSELNYQLDEVLLGCHQKLLPSLPRSGRLLWGWRVVGRCGSARGLGAAALPSCSRLIRGLGTFGWNITCLHLAK